MSAKVTVRIDGLAKVLKNLKNAPRTIQVEGDKAIYKSITLIEGGTIPYVPIDTGYLLSNRGTAFGRLFGAFKFHAPYAGFVHDGTRYMRGQPFLKEGFDSVKTRIEDVWEELGESIARQLAKK